MFSAFIYPLENFTQKFLSQNSTQKFENLKIRPRDEIISANWPNIYFPFKRHHLPEPSEHAT